MGVNFKNLRKTYLLFNSRSLKGRVRIATLTENFSSGARDSDRRLAAIARGEGIGGLRGDSTPWVGILTTVRLAGCFGSDNFDQSFQNG